MKRIFFICSISLLLAFSFSSCKKDYPKDTPKWLKVKIKEIKAEIKDQNINGGGPSEERYIAELSNGHSIIYQYFTGWRMAGAGSYYEVYDKSGNKLCGYYGAWLSGQCNDSLSIQDVATNYYKVRLIWQQR